MLAQDYLALRLSRLKPSQVVRNKDDGLLFVFAKGGAGKFTADSVTQTLTPGDVLVIPGSMGGALGSIDGHEFLLWSFSISLENVFPLLASHEIPLLENIENAFKDMRMYPAHSALAKECHRLLNEVPTHFNLEHRSQLLRVVSAIVSQEIDTAKTQRVGFVRIEEHMVQVFDKLSAQDILNLSVGELSSVFGCSRRHLNRLFHQHFGFSVAALKMEMRLLRAISLLRNPNTKIITVAEQCGFNHLGLFNICFKRRFKTSPGQWRKACLGGTSSSQELGQGDNHCQLRANGLCPWTSCPDYPADPTSQNHKASHRVAAKVTAGGNGNGGNPRLCTPALDPKHPVRNR